ncbi:MAG: hypothetical protein ACR2JI_16935, partial [Mycobacterium sp.]
MTDDWIDRYVTRTPEELAALRAAAEKRYAHLRDQPRDWLADLGARHRKHASRQSEGVVRNRSGEETMKQTTTTAAVQAANALTARWCTRLGDQDWVLSGAGLWPLLALLASAADETARAELVAALGRPADTAQQDALELIDVLRTGVSTTAALGLWTRDDIALHADWASGLPDGVVGTLTDQAALDEWASEETHGLITKFPLDVTPATMLVLASALAA